MQVRCQQCGFMFTLSREALAAALEEIEKSPAKHYTIECPQCRRQIKVPVREIRRFQPRQD
jgi:DNA-directed RNA polymerase subunit RPC12/RpoP